MSTTSISLDQLPRHTCGIVKHIDDSDESQITLKTLGICVGRKVELIQKGDPIILRVFNSRLGISKRLADRIVVEPCGPYQCAIASHE